MHGFYNLLNDQDTRFAHTDKKNPNNIPGKLAYDCVPGCSSKKIQFLFVLALANYLEGGGTEQSGHCIPIKPYSTPNTKAVVSHQIVDQQ